MNAHDPSFLVARELLPHVHLLSTFRYPSKHDLDHNEVVRWLLDAPKLARNSVPFYWTYLDQPAPTGIYLAWQPLQLLGTDFASDGYVWVGAEVFYTFEIGNGLAVELYRHDSGFRPGLDQNTTVARQRFRLVPSKAMMGAPPPQSIDPNLWIVHYKTCERPMLVNRMAIDTRTQNTMQTRQQLQYYGQILRKEFMLSDRPNWPQLPYPVPGRHMMLGAPAASRPPVPQEMAYPTRPIPTTSQPSSKRQRQQPPSGQSMPPPVMGAPPPEPWDDDEDTSRGDIFDQVAPRDLAIRRYVQNNTWMAEIIGSHHSLKSIGFSDLNLGLKGALEPLTNGIFTAQAFDALAGNSKKPYIGKLEEGKAEEFRKRVADYIETTKQEMAVMAEEHKAYMAELKGDSGIATAEKELRTCFDLGEHPEPWLVDGDGEDAVPEADISSRTLADIVASVESNLGLRSIRADEVRFIQKGGHVSDLGTHSSGDGMATSSFNFGMEF